MVTVIINISSDLITEEGRVSAALYAQLRADYTPQYGPSAQTLIHSGAYVYLWAGPVNGTIEYDYAPTSGISVVPGFATYTMPDGGQVPLPDVAASGRIVFGVPEVPTITVDNAGVPQPPLPINTLSIYDFVELSYGVQAEGILYVNTTAIDQFGIPLQIQIDPAQNTLPNGAGVFFARSALLDLYSQSSVPPAFQAGIQDLFRQTVAAPLRILSPKDVLTGKCVQSVGTSVQPNDQVELNGMLYYAVTALDEAGNESYAQSSVAGIWVELSQQITISWAPNANQPQSTDTYRYNVYRCYYGNWVLIDSPLATKFPDGVGGTSIDQDQSVKGQSPPLSDLTTWFDPAIQAFFNYYDPDQGGNVLLLNVVTGAYATDSWTYSFEGTTVSDSSNPMTDLTWLQFLLTGIVDTATQVAVPEERWPFPASTPFNVYYPYWSSNVDPTCPDPPSWMLYPNSPASLMVFAANGVFADNIEQVYYNLPEQVPPPTTTYPTPPPPTTPAGIWQLLLATLENMIASALSRGIAAPVDGVLSIAPSSWASQPTQLAPALDSTPSSLLMETTYYYVVTTVLDGNESAPSLEFTASPTSEEPSVQINWLPQPTWQAASFNVYRGTQSQGENTLVANIPNSGQSQSCVDSGGGTAQQPPTYYPPGALSDAYAAFFHQPIVSIAGAAYAAPFDDQGNQSTTLSGMATSLTINVGPWAP